MSGDTKTPPEIKTNEAFNEAIRQSDLVVIHFCADWLDQCKQINDFLTTLNNRTDEFKVKCYQLPAENLSEVSLKYNVSAVPTTILFRNQKEVDRVNGADPTKILDAVKAQTLKDSSSPKGNLEDRLKALINKSKVMLFMKGNRTEPRCGFSRQIVQILNDTGVAYETFDILTDEEVRQGLKTYSDWPTYPQLYVNGELVGGLDIVKEMLANNELLPALNA